MPRRRTLLLPAAFLLATIAARPCGPDFPSAVFVLTTGPDGNYASYAAGHLGVPQTAYRTRHLVIAYDYLTRRPLSTNEQQQAIAVNSYFISPWETDQPDKPLPGFDSWLKVHDAFGPVDGFAPDGSLTTSRSTPGQDYSSFTNCLDDAFANAARTLKARVATYSSKDPAVIDWVRGQDAVFTNCGDGKPTPYYGPGKAPPPPPAPHAPAAAPANAPLWLKQDRSYQLAAARFYALDLDASIADFRSIAADSSSPWSSLSRYLVARALIRKAEFGETLPTVPYDNTLTPAQREARDAELQKQQLLAAKKSDAVLALAQHELVAMRPLPQMAALRHAIDDLLDYVNIRIDPSAQALVLAQRLQSPDSPRFGQALIDLTYMRSNPSMAEPTPNPAKPTSSAADMLAWIDIVSTNNETLSLQHFHTTRTTPWLLAAISFAQPGDAATPELIAAAAAVQPTDPGYAAITYHRLRLQPPNAATRAELLVLLPKIQKDENTSTTNLFTALSASTANSLNDWLAATPRYSATDDTPENIVAMATEGTTTTQENVCGHKFSGDAALFDTDAANALNRNMPLRLLAKAAESPALPENLRFQVAQAAWARALLLDANGTNATYQSIAHRMEPVLLACRAVWKPVFDTYNAATTPEARHAAALLALMRFASTEPSVRDGEERRNGFATYDTYRQNWWCKAVPPPGETVDYWTDMSPTPPPAPGPTSSARNLNPPLFLTAADLAEANAEVSALEKIPSASTYFATQALTWAKLHPKDPETPNILGEADRALRNSCRKDPPYNQRNNQQVADPNDMTLTPNLAKAIFTVLHRDYPNSPWAKRYKSWQ